MLGGIGSLVNSSVRVAAKAGELSTVAGTVTGGLGVGLIGVQLAKHKIVHARIIQELERMRSNLQG